MKRREFLAALGSATFGGAVLAGCQSTKRLAFHPFELEGRSIAELQGNLTTGLHTSRSLTAGYQRRWREIDRIGPTLNSVLAINPDAMAIAASLDQERGRKSVRGPLHGIPILLKDNIATGDLMRTTAGSLALASSVAPRDSFVAARLRAAGAVIWGKTNLSEWANFRGSRSISGWSAVGRQTRNPYCTACSPSGSSSGSAVAVAASLCAAAVGTETNGSIVSPASYCGIVGLKPTVGLISRTGIIPISSSQDTAGPMGRTVADVAALLGAMTGVDERDPATAHSAGKARLDYRSCLEANALQGARLGVPRPLFKLQRRVDPIFEEALKRLRASGAELIESIELPSRQALGGADYQVMLYEFKQGLNDYFASLGSGAPVRSVEELIAFNERHQDEELKYFGQETLIEAQAKGPLSDQAYLDAKARCRKWSEDLQSVIERNRLDAVVAPTTGPAHALDYVHSDRGLGGCSTYAAVAGFPHITVPCGFVLGLPVGLSFFGVAWTEPRLLALAFAFERVSPPRRPPRFVPNVEALT